MCSFVFFFKQKTAYEMRISDWSSDVCSSDLQMRHGEAQALRQTTGRDDLILANVILEGCSHRAVHIQHVKTKLSRLRTAEDCPSSNADRAALSTRPPLQPAYHRHAGAR